MTIQTNSSSPFIDNSNAIPKDLPVSPTEDFSIRTMHDDLLSLQKGERPIETTVEIKVPQSTVETKKTAEPITSFQIPLPKNNSISKSSFDDLKKHGPTDFIEMPIAEKSNASPSFLYKILLGAIVFFIVAIIGLGIYYFFLRSKPIVQAPAEIPIETPVPEAPAPPIETPATIPIEKYSSATPNYLSFDPANETLADLNKTLTSITNELKNQNSQSIYEFSVVDSNNNPVVLPIFTAATKFNLSPTLLKSLGETFSIFFYNDAGNIRLSIATTVKDKKIVVTEMAKQEATLVSDTSFLFIEPTPEKKPIKFSTSDYNGNPVRYTNLAFNPNLSIDYIITDSNFIIGTSKNAARAVLDKINNPQQQNNLITNQPTQNQDDTATKQSAGTCADLTDKLASCTPYSCSSANIITGENMKKEIIGLVDGKCNYTEQMPNNGKMECNYTDDLRRAVVQYYKDLASANSAGTSVTSSLEKTEIKYTINGKEVSNPLQEASETGQCVISGYTP